MAKEKDQYGLIKPGLHATPSEKRKYLERITRASGTKKVHDDLDRQIENAQKGKTVSKPKKRR